ncbi:MAG: hypothetical protein PHG14_14600 [Desulfobacter postgatei]|uniref:hypothetical protein n=1 Tax=Desulfobacter postgatei TaxID=2293 RepID=UPI0023F3E2BC|nr:hypothetical protein [Desulfobacter postgatei]MDD4274943.1 hypothetical protein [Desulfobacter postgatei]
MTGPRTHFIQSRQMDFFTTAELTKQMGTSPNLWWITLVKELIDNSLDAAESVGIDPVISVTIDEDSFSIQDNGPGIPDKVIEGSIDYGVRVSDKNLYVSPSRGRQGNALMCLYAVPFCLNGKQARVDIHANGTCHQIDISLNQILQQPEVIDTKSKSDFIENGTFIKIHDVDLATSLNFEQERISTKREYVNLIRLFAVCNCHANFKLIFDGESMSWHRTGPQEKWTPDKPLVSHWYNHESFDGFLAATIHQNPDMSVNQFLGKFDGLKSTPKWKTVCTAVDIHSRDGLKQFVTDKDIDRVLSCRLLDAMKEQAKEVPSKSLGNLNADHVEKNWRSCESKIYEHASLKSKKDYFGLPYTIDVFFQALEGLRYKRPDICLNNSVLIDGYIRDSSSFFHETFVEHGDEVRLLIHVACPHFDFSGMGKNSLSLPDAIRSDLIGLIKKVCIPWTRLKKLKRRNQKAMAKDAIKREKESNVKITQKDAAFQVMEQSYMDASSQNTLPANFRQIYYQARPHILRLAGVDRLGDDYFRELVTEYQALNPASTKDWNVAYDPRGHLVEPFTGRKIPMGTLGVKDYIQAWNGVSIFEGGTFSPPEISDPNIEIIGHQGRYKFALFIEKEGFQPLFEVSKIQERYGVAILSTKGMSNRAARFLVENLSINGVTVFVLRDFDKSGFTIAKTLSTNTKTYQFEHKPNVIDLGFRLEDIQGLEHEPVTYQGVNSPRESIISSGATQEEADLLVQGGYKNNWHGIRVELNAMPSKQFIHFIEKKLEDHGVKKVVPDENVLRGAYQKFKLASKKRKFLHEVMEKFMPEIRKELAGYETEDIDVPDDLKQKVLSLMAGKNNTLPWEDALTRLI